MSCMHLLIYRHLIEYDLYDCLGSSCLRQTGFRAMVVEIVVFIFHMSSGGSTNIYESIGCKGELFIVGHWSAVHLRSCDLT